MAVTLEHATTAFILSIAAGSMTMLGASIVFCPALVKRTNHKVLASGLGFSSGVMVLIGFIDIWTKSKDAFTDYGYNEAYSFAFATGSIFIGAIIMRIIDYIVYLLSGKHATTIEFGQPIGNGEASINKQDEAKLKSVSLSAAMAIALHNFPEGIAVFVATLENPTVGAALAVGIAFHNIPEGLSVALPMYYATGNRCLAFGWAFLSGVAEPIGALIAYAIIYFSGEEIHQMVYATMFGIVTGIMVMISMTGLLPTAYKFDPQGDVVANSLIAGMAFMATSLVLFQFA